MRFIISLIVLLLLSQNVWALQSPIASTVPGLDIPNSHLVLRDHKQQELLYRGNAPRLPSEKQAPDISKTEIAQDILDLKNLGIENIIIFKNQSHSEVDREVYQLKKAGYSDEQILLIPFPWKDYPSFRQTCRQSMQALRFIKDKMQKKEKTFLHCTVGEDRTGYLSALARIYFQDWPVRTAFFSEMCQKGYGAGDPHKPPHVVQAIRDELTFIYSKMAFLISTYRSLDSQICDLDPERISDYRRSSWWYEQERLKCWPTRLKLIKD